MAHSSDYGKLLLLPTIARVIPPTFSAMVERAGQDNNHLLKAVNVHESAFTWVHRYKTSNTLSEKRRLK
jgi:hypothetical protein